MNESFEIGKIDNGYIVRFYMPDGDGFKEHSEFCKNIPQVVRKLKAFYSPKDGNVIPF